METKGNPDLSKVFDLALGYNPMLAMRDISTIHAWINYGCDVELDILPTMQEVLKRRPANKEKISTFSYFTNPVMASKDKRALAPVVTEATREKSQAEKDEARAKHLRWVRDKKVVLASVGAHDFRWLADYEAQRSNNGLQF